MKGASKPRWARSWGRAALALGVGAGLLLGPGGDPDARERGADGRFDRRRSSHFLLLQDVDIDHRSGKNGGRAFERNILEVLEGAYATVADELGLRPRTDTVIYVYDPGVFDARFASSFGFRAAGFFNGAIHTRGAIRVTPQLARTLHHEYVHAALHSEVGPGVVPAWLNEGLAEYFEALAVGRRGLSRGESNVLGRALASDVFIPIGALSSASFVHLQDASAGLAYLQSFALVDHLIRREGMTSMRRMLDRIARSRSWPRALFDTYRLRPEDLEAALIDELVGR